MGRTTENVFSAELDAVVNILDFFFFFPQSYACIDSFVCRRLQGWTHGQASCLFMLLNRKAPTALVLAAFICPIYFCSNITWATPDSWKTACGPFFRRVLLAQGRNVLQATWIPLGKFRFCTQSTGSQERIAIQVTSNTNQVTIFLQIAKFQRLVLLGVQKRIHCLASLLMPLKMGLWVKFEEESP